MSLYAGSQELKQSENMTSSEHGCTVTEINEVLRYKTYMRLVGEAFDIHIYYRERILQPTVDDVTLLTTRQRDAGQRAAEIPRGSCLLLLK